MYIQYIRICIQVRTCIRIYVGAVKCTYRKWQCRCPAVRLYRHDTYVCVRSVRNREQMVEGQMS